MTDQSWPAELAVIGAAAALVLTLFLRCAWSVRKDRKRDQRKDCARQREGPC